MKPGKDAPSSKIRLRKHLNADALVSKDPRSPQRQPADLLCGCGHERLRRVFFEGSLSSGSFSKRPTRPSPRAGPWSLSMHRKTGPKPSTTSASYSSPE